MRAIFFILVGIGLTLGAIYYVGPDRFIELYKGAATTGQGMISGSQPAQSPAAEAPAAQTSQPPAGSDAQ